MIIQGQGDEVIGVYYFTKKQIELLSNNEYVVKVSEKSITYPDKLKLLLLLEYSNGFTPKEIFEKHGFPYSILGEKRILNYAHRWKKLNT